MTQRPNSTAGSSFAMIRGHHVLSAVLGPRSVVLDVGANHGEFARELQCRYGCFAVLVEANPRLCLEIERTTQLRVLHAAVAAESGTLSFNISQNDEGSSILALPEVSTLGCVLAETVEVPAKTLAEASDFFGLDTIDLLKMDIEGAEVEVLQNCPVSLLRRVAQITVEFHCADVFGFGGRDAVEAVIARLRSCGFTPYVFDPDFTDVLFVNHSAVGTPFWRRALLRLRMSPPRWLSRLWSCMPKGVHRAARSVFGATKE